ncbi:MAG: sugar transferase [Candidatus Omnitrophota bacterium]
MHKERENVLARVFMVIDAFVISFAFIVSFFIREHLSGMYTFNFFPQIELNINYYLAIYLILVFLWCAALFFSGMYRSIHIKLFPNTAWILIKSAVLVTVSFSVIVFLVKFHLVSRLLFIIFMFITPVFIMLEKVAVLSFTRHFLGQDYNRIRILIVGTGQRAIRLMDAITAHPEWRYHIVKVVDYAQCLITQHHYFKECEIIETGEDIRKILRSNSIDQTIFVVPRSRLDLVERYIHVCEEEGISAAVAVDFFNTRESQLSATDIDGIPLLALEKTFDKEWHLFVKRVLDVIISGLGIIVFSPLFLVVAILIKFTSPGPVFFRQERVSLHGRKFTMYKFRSMYREAEKELKKLLSLNEVEGPIFKIKNDPRITQVGRFLRRYSIDELPQLFNVFIGQMSLVGPRPALPVEVEQYTASERRRLSVRPGITCLWQAYHRGEKSFEKWMKTDLEYVEEWSLMLDFEIFLRTIIEVISGSGAY